MEVAQPIDDEYMPSGGEEEEEQPASNMPSQEQQVSNMPNQEQPVSIMPSPSELERKQLQLDGKKSKLEQLSQYGGGVNAAGLPVPYRMTNPKSGLKQPRDQLPEFWDLATTNQKRAIENENASKRNKLRE